MNKIKIHKSDNLYENDVYSAYEFEQFIKSTTEKNKLSNMEVDNLKKSTVKILRNCVKPKFQKDNYDSNTGLVLGYVQSGKTLSFTSLITLAKDNGYKIVIIFAGSTNLLLEQTIGRLYDDLPSRDDYVIIKNPNLEHANRISKTLNNKYRDRLIILPILKNHKYIKDLNSLFKSRHLVKFLSQNSVIIIDDEADQASLNTRGNFNFKNKQKNIEIDEQSTTYNEISQLKSVLKNHSYIQYTATPQANLLLESRDLLLPNWVEVLKPGLNYTGGLEFFTSNKNSHIIEIKTKITEGEDEPPIELVQAFDDFLIKSALLSYDYEGSERTRKKMKTSMMIHADRKILENNKYLIWIKRFHNAIELGLKSEETEIIDRFRLQFLKIKTDLSSYFNTFPSFDKVIKKVTYWVLEDLNSGIWFVTGKGDNEVIWKDSKHHVLIGGQKLDRGFTVKDLITTYMPRETKGTSNADTIQQRCRFFGYRKNYIEACKVYLPFKSICEYEEYIAFEEHLRNFLINNDVDEFYNNDKLMKLGILNPTAKNKIPANLLRSSSSKYQYFEPDLDNSKANNLKIVTFIESLDFKGELRYKDNPSDDNIHKVYKTYLNKTQNLLNDIIISKNKEKLKRTQILDQIDKNEKIWVIEMSYKRETGRPRTLKNNGNILSLASNHPPEFGDRILLKEKSASGDFNYNGEPILQIHKIRIKDNKNYNNQIKQHIGKMIYILCFSFNEELSHSFISAKYD